MSTGQDSRGGLPYNFGWEGVRFFGSRGGITKKEIFFEGGNKFSKFCSWNAILKRFWAIIWGSPEYWWKFALDDKKNAGVNFFKGMKIIQKPMKNALDLKNLPNLEGGHFFKLGGVGYLLVSRGGSVFFARGGVFPPCSPPPLLIYATKYWFCP